MRSVIEYYMQVAQIIYCSIYVPSKQTSICTSSSSYMSLAYSIGVLYTQLSYPDR